MTTLQAGIGKCVITPRVGAKLIGYFNRPSASTGVHDDLHVRVIVLSNESTSIALCSVELLWLWSTKIGEIKKAVAAQCSLKPENILIFCTHTHSGPSPFNTDDWDIPLTKLIADTIAHAFQSQQPAKLNFGFGQLFGHNINRRWLNRPADPSVAVLRVDTAEGKPLALLGNYACHAVVMGYDSFLISGDWPGYAMRILEEELTARSNQDCVALFSQGGAGDVNPLTETVRQRLEAGHPVGTIGKLTSYYGDSNSTLPDSWNIEDRAGGTFFEAETIARAYAAEVMRIWKRIDLSERVPMWTERIIVNGAVDADEPPAQGLPPEYSDIIPSNETGRIDLEIMLIGIGSAILYSQPGEVFGETAFEFRKNYQQLGYSFPILISYANGSYAYLPPSNAFEEGGYEVVWARRYGLSSYLQDRIASAIKPVLQKHIPTKK